MFTRFAVLLLEHWKLFSVDWRYGCQDTCENIYFTILQLFLRHLQFYFQNILCYFASIECTVAKIQAKKLLDGFEMVFTAFAVLLLEHWKLFCVDWIYGCHYTGDNIFFKPFKLGFVAFSVLFLEYWRLFFVDWRYGCQIWAKIIFAGFEIAFTSFVSLFLEHWGLFCIDWRYFCKDIGENTYSQALKWRLRHFPFNFQNIGGYFASIGDTIAEIRAKLLISKR